MKKVFSIVALTILVWGCTKKMSPAKTTTPSSNTGSVISANDNKTVTVTNTPATNTVSEISNSGTNATKTAVKERSISAADLSLIEGQSTFNAKCNRCHAYKVTTDYTDSRWVSIMQVMAIKANLTETEKSNVLAYVRANSKKG